MSISLIGFASLMVLIFARVPIGLSMGLIGFFGFAYLSDFNWIAALSMASRRVIDTSRSTLIPGTRGT
jgi:hypothetical protein